MARYFFDLTDGMGFHRDEFGAECADLQEARDQAVSLLPDIAREELSDGDPHDIRVEVRDEEYQLIYAASLSLHAKCLKDEPSPTR